MISGIGLDIVELDRIAKLEARSEKFASRILTHSETVIYRSLAGHRRTEFLAGRFAGKEAFSKARGTGIGAGCNFTDLGYLTSSEDRPHCGLSKSIRGNYEGLSGPLDLHPYYDGRLS